MLFYTLKLTPPTCRFAPRLSFTLGEREEPDAIRKLWGVGEIGVDSGGEGGGEYGGRVAGGGRTHLMTSR